MDLKQDLIPVTPSAHYTMGGIPANLDCGVINNEQEVNGLMAIGESACVSVHGANRLGCNSLLDLIVFGKIAGEKASQKIINPRDLKAEELARKKIENLRNIFDKCYNNSEINIFNLRDRLQEVNENNLGVFRDQILLIEHLQELKVITDLFQMISIKNKSLLWNDELISYLELENLLLNSLATAFASLNRKESRGAHYHNDFPKRDDKNFFHHSLVYLKNLTQNSMEFSTKSVMVTSEVPELNLTLQPRNY